MFNEEKFKALVKPRDEKAHKRHMERLLDYHQEKLMDLRKSLLTIPKKEHTLQLNWDEYQPDEHADLYDVDGTWLGPIYDITEFNWVRLQVMKQNVSGCYIVYKGEKHELMLDGSIEGRLGDLFDKTRQYMFDIFKITDPREQEEPKWSKS